MLGLNTPTPQVFWNGVSVPNITHIRTDWEADEQRVKLSVSALDPIHTEMSLAGIIIKKERTHE